MKKLLVFISIILLPIFSWSQTKKIKYWIDNDSTKGLQKVVEVLEMDTNVYHGRYLHFYQKGNLKIEGQFDLNRFSGTWKDYYESGSVKKTRNYLNDSLCYWTYYFENGKKTKEGLAKNHQKDGIWEYYYESGETKIKGKYWQGKKDSIWHHFYEGGNKKGIGYYEKGSGTYTEYYINGKVKEQGPVVNDVNEGIWRSFYESGKLKAKGYESNGTQHGQWSYFYENDSLSSQGNYINGKKTGDWKFFHENGVMSSEGIMNSGLRDGFWEFFDEDGRFEGDVMLNNGNGVYKEYYSNGSIKVKGSLKDDKSHGKWFYYFEDGKQKGEAFFDKGIGQYTGYYRSGKLSMKGRIEHGKQAGIWDLYYDNDDNDVAGHYVIRSKYFMDSDEMIVGTTDNDAPIYHNQKKDLPQYKESTPDTQKQKQKRSRARGRHSHFHGNGFHNPFKQRRGELHGWIFSANPFAIVRNEIPLSVEYFVQERIGYEARYTFRRAPFFLGENIVPDSALFIRGYSIDFKQKFYGRFRRDKILYLAHELRYANENILAKIDNGQNRSRLEERSFEYALTVGGRFLSDIRSSRVTLDVYTGLGVAYIDQKWAVPDDLMGLYEGYPSVKYKLKPRLGFSIGYLLYGESVHRSFY